MPTESDYKIVGGPGATLDDNLKAAVGKLNVVQSSPVPTLTQRAGVTKLGGPGRAYIAVFKSKNRIYKANHVMIYV